MYLLQKILFYKLFLLHFDQNSFSAKIGKAGICQVFQNQNEVGFTARETGVYGSQ